MTESNCYGDGTVFRGVRSADSSLITNDCEDYLKRIIDETVAENEVLVKEIASLRSQLDATKGYLAQAERMIDDQKGWLAEAKVSRAKDALDAERLDFLEKCSRDGYDAPIWACWESEADSLRKAIDDEMKESKDAD